MEPGVIVFAASNDRPSRDGLSAAGQQTGGKVCRMIQSQWDAGSPANRSAQTSRTLSISAAALIALAVATLLWLAGCGSGTVSGTIIDKSARTPVRNATVTLGDRQVVTGADGAFLFTDVANSQLEVSIVAKGFERASRRVTVDGGTTQTVLEMTRVLPAKVQLIAPASGDSVAGGSTVRVAAVTSGFTGTLRMRLVVDGSVTGRVQVGKTCSFPWHTPKKAANCVLRVVATTDGVVVSSDRVRVHVKYSAPASPSGENSTGDTSGSHWWGSFYYASKRLNEAESQAARGSSFGYSTYVLNTLDYANLGKPGEEWWVVCAGKYGSYAEAQAAAVALRADGFSGAYAKEVY